MSLNKFLIGTFYELKEKVFIKAYLITRLTVEIILLYYVTYNSPAQTALM